MSQLEFMVATQDDKGRPTHRKGWLQKVNTHTAVLGVAARKRKALQDRVDLANESQQRLAATALKKEQVYDEFDGQKNFATASGPSAPGSESPFSVESLNKKIHGASSDTESASTQDQAPDFILLNEGVNGADYWVIRCQEYQTTTKHVDCAQCGPFEAHLPTDARHYRQCLQVQRWLWTETQTQEDAVVEPFIHASADLTPRESALLQFWLQGRRSMSPGVLENTSTKTDIKTGHAHPGVNSIFTLTHLAMSEHHLSRLTGRLRPNFYCHRAEAYRAANDIFSSPAASLAVKFSALQNLHVMDLTIGCPDVLALHAQARDHFLASHGGLTQLFTENRNSFALLDAANVLLMVLWSTSVNQFLDIGSFNAASREFTASLSSISSHVAVLAHQPSHNEIQNHQHAARLAPLFMYLGNTVHHHLRQVTDYGYTETVGACTLTLLFDLVVSIAEIDGTVLAAVSRLEQLQHCMMASINSNAFSDQPHNEEAEAQLCRLAPCTVLVMVSHLRKYEVVSGHSSPDPAQEAKVCSASINAVRMFPLLSSSTRLRIARGLLECLVGITMEEGVDPFSEQTIGEIATELRSGWMA